jgi:hypothetical protein
MILDESVDAACKDKPDRVFSPAARSRGSSTLTESERAIADSPMPTIMLCEPLDDLIVGMLA